MKRVFTSSLSGKKWFKYESVMKLKIGSPSYLLFTDRVERDIMPLVQRVCQIGIVWQLGKYI